ncbi:MAG: MoaD/ThiS family protein [Planctomycetota bacterium]|nr:MoaD/ThiS family protein [Planctomycetota bacterium]
MKLNVKLFARAKDVAGADTVEVELPDQSTVGELRQALTEQFPGLGPIAGSLLIAVGNDYADDFTPLVETLDVACFPPVSGG